LHLEWNFADMKYQELIGYNSWFANDRFDCWVSLSKKQVLKI
jgi:hypothetical protein